MPRRSDCVEPNTVANRAASAAGESDRSLRKTRPYCLPNQGFGPRRDPGLRWAYIEPKHRHELRVDVTRGRLDLFNPDRAPVFAVQKPADRIVSVS